MTITTVLAAGSRSLRASAVSASRLGASSSPNYITTRFNSGTMHDNDPEVLELEKHRNLSNTQHRTSTPHEHAPGWNEHLASASEASVKADRAEGSPAELQSKTINYIKNRHNHEDSAQPTEALYSREEVGGPLGAAGKKDETVVKKSVHDEVIEVVKEKSSPTPSEESVKADRGEI